MLLSIIIPHHNLVDLLKRSLDSIPERSDIEVIVVDDNSSQECIEQLKTLCLKKNARIIYTHEGKGAGYARNVGLDHAIGKWVLMCDSDDYFTPEMPAYVDEYANSDYDVIFFGFQTRDSGTLERMPSRVIGYEKALKEHTLEYFKFRFHGPWAKLIRKDFIDLHSIRCDEVICANDTFFAGKVGAYAKYSVLDTREIYVTTIRQGSLVHYMNIERLTTRIDVNFRYNRFLKQYRQTRYRVNMISLIFYLRKADRSLFIKYLHRYWKEESIRHICRDAYKSIKGYWRHVTNPQSNLRNKIVISNQL